MSSNIAALTRLPAPASTATPWRIHVYAHTHWDREWYQPFERFRMQLVAAVDLIIEVLERDPAFTTFVLDGQTIVLDDYLAVRPHMRDRLRQLVMAGRIEVGPWYVLPDEFLVSAESMVRNLLEGRRGAAAMGGALNVGYLPDPFGHVAQLPAILAGFGIGSVVFSRGMGDEFAQLGSEFTWLSPDGRSSVLALVQTATNTNGYCNAEVLSKAHADSDVPLSVSPQELVGPLAVHLASHATASGLLFAAGCDHETINPELPQLLDQLGSLVDVPIELCGLARHVAQVEESLRTGEAELPAYSGELRGALHAPLLAGIFSARIPLKQDNVRVQTLLERVVEPLRAIAHVADVLPADVGMLQHAWRIAMQNQPHDSIGGCSTDVTHLDMPPRTRAVEQVCAGMLEDVAIAAGSVDRPLVWNPHPMALGGVASRSDGTRVLVEGVPALGCAALDDVAVAASGQEQVACARRMIESDRFVVTALDDGIRIDVKSPDGQITHTLHRALEIVDRADGGDEYDFGAIDGDREIVATLVAAESQPVAPGIVELVLTHRISIPRELAADRRTRSATAEEHEMVTSLQLAAGQPWVGCRVEWQNRSLDHRLRVRVALGAAATSSVADSHHAMVERPVRPAPARVEWTQDPIPSQHCEAGVALDAVDGDRGVALLTRGLHEYEAVIDADGHAALELTILRSIGWLSRDDIAGRPCHAGPELATPDAQCIGAHCVELGIAPYEGTWQQARIPRLIRAHAAPPFVIEPIEREFRQHSGQQARERDVLAVAGNPSRAERVARLGSSLISTSGAELVACKPADDGSGDIVLRWANPYRSPEPVVLEVSVPVESITAVRLDELPDAGWEPEVELSAAAGRATWQLPAGALASVRVATGVR